MFQQLERINARPDPFEFYTARDLWTDEHTSQRMLAFHLDERLDAASRKGEFIDRSVGWIVSHFHVGAGTKIADFGCGPGLYTTRLARRQADVTGIDFSERSICHATGVATAEGLPIRYVHQDYLEFETADRFDLILMIMCDFCALGPDRRAQMLDKFHAILKPSGAVLLDVYSLAAFDRWREAAVYEVNLLDGFWAPDKYYGFCNTFKYDNQKVVLDKYTIIEPTRTRAIYNWFQCFSPEALANEFADCGFSIETLYSNVAGLPYDSDAVEFAVVARKN